MAKAVKFGKSYMTVVELIRNTHEWKTLVNRVKRRLQTARIEKFNHSFSPYSDSMSSFCTVVFGDDDSGITRKELYGTYFGVSVADALEKDEIKSIIEDLMILKPGMKKTKIPTYNCHPDKIVQYMEGNTMIDDVVDLDDVRFRLSRQHQSYIESDQYQMDRENVRNEHIVTEVVKVLSRFKDVKKEVLQRAFNEFIVLTVMDD